MRDDTSLEGNYACSPPARLRLLENPIIPDGESRYVQDLFGHFVHRIKKVFYQ